MVGVLIVAHGALGEALIHGASHVLGKRPLQVQQLGVTVHDDPDAILPQAQELARQLDSGDGVLVLTDILGATRSEERRVGRECRTEVRGCGGTEESVWNVVIYV